ncbi:uncharacterized protein LOC121391033 [Gigantopelta aegis]|uniref:uncharacterized protein LOC121391033 n=1 Tax=Gigantopelta aegis TaxID=1735272 RepID=UPI001B888246|nr:uncharacterized protein LOC121391033 [Gigantopelta aegis]
MDEFVTYFEETWLVGNFGPRLWIIFSSDASSPRTNNHLEGWHNKLKRIARKAHPNVFELVKIFKQEQSSTEVSIAQLEAGSQPPKRAKKSVEKDNKIGEIKSRFDQISLEENIRGISAHTAI